jgi:peptidoglycan/LPS O-acetylase OafA/YrhL
MWYHGHAFSWNQAGNFAVQIFFALSGWLIGGILLETTPGALPRFYFNRAVRIWVPYYLAAALLLGLSVLREPITAKWLEIVTYKLTFVYNLFGVPQLALFRDAMPQKGSLSHFWSVNVEEQFYLMAPLFLVLLAHRAGRSPWLWAVLACLGFPFGLGAIMLGVLAATIVHRHGRLHERRDVRIALALGLAAAAAALYLDLQYELVAPFAGLFIVLLLAMPGRRSRWGALFGGMSYPLYLNHWIAVFAGNLVLAHAHLRAGAAATALNVAVETLVGVPFAIALYWFVDRRLLAHRARSYTPRRGRAITVLAYAIIAAGLAYGLAMRPAFERAEQAARATPAPAAAPAPPG